MVSGINEGARLTRVSATTLYRLLGGAPAAKSMRRGYQGESLVITVCKRVQEHADAGRLAHSAWVAAEGVMFGLVTGRASSDVCYYLLHSDVRSLCALLAEAIAVVESRNLNVGQVPGWINRAVRYEHGRDAEGKRVARRMTAAECAAQDAAWCLAPLW